MLATTVVVAAALPNIIGLLIDAYLSILTATLKVGVAVMETLKVTVIVEPEGIVGNPEIFTPDEV